MQTDQSSPVSVLHILAMALRGGVEKNCYHFVRACPNFYHKVVVLDGEGPMIDDLKEAGANIEVLHLLEKHRTEFYRGLRATLPEGQFQKIIVWTNIRMPWIMHALNKYKADVYVHIGNPVGGGWSEWIQSWILPTTNTIRLRPVSAYVERSLKQSRYHRRFESRVSLKPVPAPVVTARKPEPLTSQSPVQVGMVARLDPIKDHASVIQAFRLLVREYPAAVLNLVGDGVLREALQNLVTEEGLEASVVFHGEVADVYSRMKNWDLFLYASTPREGLGGTIPEALSMGLPVVATDLPMIREWDPDGDLIRFCKPGDPADMAKAARDLLADFDKRAKINSHAPGFIHDHYSPEIFSYNYISNP